MPQLKTFRIRRIGGKARTVWVLTVPMEIANALDPTQEFVLELTDEGLLYRAVEQHQPELPAWAKREKGSTE